MITFNENSAHKIAKLLEKDTENTYEAVYFDDGGQSHKVTEIKPIYEDFECGGMSQSVLSSMLMELSNTATLQINFLKKTLLLIESCGKVNHLN